MSRIKHPEGVQQRAGKPYEDKKHLEYVASFQCCVPGCHERSGPPHHNTGPDAEPGSRGTSRKGGDHTAVPMCHQHHTEFHNGPESFRRKYLVELGAVAAELWTMGQKARDNET